jgi:hypothetical protein
MIEPVFEELARAKRVPDGGGGGQQVVFVKVDLGVGMPSVVTREYGVAAAPTFGDGKRVRLWLDFVFSSMWLSIVLACRFMN